MASNYDTIAPNGLPAPAYANSWLGNREETILRHGFSEQLLGLDWWHRELKKAGLEAYTPRVDPIGGDSGLLTRSDLFALGAQADGEAAMLTFFFNVLAWGSGPSRRHNKTRIEAFADERARSNNLQLLHNAAEEARSGTAQGTRHAYSTLIRRGGGQIPGLGPAFFTKFLYFVGGGKGEIPCLILDARVARSLHSAGWGSLPQLKTRTGWSYSYNWYTNTYVSYCELLARWAREARSSASPDEFERALFEGRERP